MFARDAVGLGDPKQAAGSEETREELEDLAMLVMSASPHQQAQFGRPTKQGQKRSCIAWESAFARYPAFVPSL